MKKYIIIASVFAALLSAASCQRESVNEAPAGEGLSLTFTCNDIDTKADKPGTGNENLIKTLDVFLFPETDGKFLHHWRFTPEIEDSFTCFIQAAVIASANYKVYSIANYPGLESDFVIGGENATQAQLQALALSESSYRTFTAASGPSVNPAANEDLCLVMTGFADNITVQVVPGQTLVGKAEVELKRLPAKVTMDFYLKDEVVYIKGDITETWTPLSDGNNIRVHLCGAASDALVGGRDADSPIFDYLPNMDNTSITGKTDFATAFASTSFYTYPETWAYGATNEPYIKLIVPWKLSRNTAGIIQESQKEFYYKVMLPTNTFESNNWYHLVLDVTQLGGDAEDDAVNVPCGYQVLDWRTMTEITSAMAPGYYLDVNVPDMSDIRFYGNTVDIPYFASGPVEIKSRVKEWDDYTTGNHEDDTNTSDVANSSEGNYIHISNVLNYDFTSTNYDVSPYKYTIVLKLKSDNSGLYDKTLVVTQYPPLYITNTDTRNDDDSKPNMYVNGYYETSGDSRAWDSVGPTTTGTMGQTHIPHYLGSVNANTDAMSGSGSNTNPNLYSVTTTILKFAPVVDGQPLETVLGDPRAAATNEYQNILKGRTGSESLVNYRPTADDTQNVISPKFISASSYGKTYSVSYEGARRRCASYQEYGYPAGRWRLPTKAEILFLQKLNADGKIPTLFSPSATSGYWAAGNQLYIRSGSADSFVDMTIGTAPTNSVSGESIITVKNGTNYNGFVRCVYDTWYWGDLHSATTSGDWLGFKTSLTDTF